MSVFFFQGEGSIRDLVVSCGLGDVYKGQCKSLGSIADPWGQLQVLGVNCNPRGQLQILGVSCRSLGSVANPWGQLQSSGSVADTSGQLQIPGVCCHSFTSVSTPLFSSCHLLTFAAAYDLFFFALLGLPTTHT